MNYHLGVNYLWNVVKNNINIDYFHFWVLTGCQGYILLTLNRTNNYYLARMSSLGNLQRNCNLGQAKAPSLRRPREGWLLWGSGRKLGRQVLNKSSLEEKESLGLWLLHAMANDGYFAVPEDWGNLSSSLCELGWGLCACKPPFKASWLQFKSLPLPVMYT